MTLDLASNNVLTRASMGERAGDLASFRHSRARWVTAAEWGLALSSCETPPGTVIKIDSITGSITRLTYTQGAWHSNLLSGP